MVFGETEARVEALGKAAAIADEKTVAFIQALSDDAVKTSGDKVFVVRDEKAFDPITGAELPLPADAEDVINPNLMRSEIDNALAALKLFSKDEKLRRDAIKTLAGDSDEARLPLIEKAYAAETVPQLKSQLELLRAAILLGSSDKAKRLASWLALEKALDNHELVTGTVTGKVKGGLTVMVNGIRAFLPGSLVDTRPVKDTTPYEGKTLEFRVIKLDRKRNNVVLSRRAVIEATQGEERAKLLEASCLEDALDLNHDL